MQLFATNWTRRSCRSANVLSNWLRTMLLPIRPSCPKVFEPVQPAGCHIAWSRDKGYRSHKSLTGSKDGFLPPIAILTTLIERFCTSNGCEGSGRILTQSTKQLGFGGGDNPAFQRDAAASLRPGELPDGRSRKMRETVRSGFELPETMSESNPHLELERQKHNRWLVLIAAYKFLLAGMFVAVGIGALRLMHKDIDDVISHLGDMLRFNPESRFVNFLYDKATIINDPLLKRIGALAFSYAAVSLVEGVGLYLEKAWGEYLTLAITASFLPWEIFEVFHRLTFVRVGLLVVNAFVFIYLLRIVVARRKPLEADPSE